MDEEDEKEDEKECEKDEQEDEEDDGNKKEDKKDEKDGEETAPRVAWIKKKRQANAEPSVPFLSPSRSPHFSGKPRPRAVPPGRGRGCPLYE